MNTAISIGGVAVGVMALLVVLGVMSGFQDDLQRKILGVNTHLVVLNFQSEMSDYERVIKEALQVEGVVAASPFALGQVMVAAGGRAQGVYMRGVEPELEMDTTEIESHMKAGSLLELLNPQDVEGTERPGIVLGGELADRLGVYVGDLVKIISPFGGMGPMGNLPKVKRFEVVGIFEVGMFEYDSNLVLTSLPPAQDFLELGSSVTGVEVKVEDIYSAGAIGERIKSRLGHPYYAKDWMQMNRNLFAALKLEKLAMFVILTLIVLVAAFNIVSTQLMNVIEKEREIAILKAMGATNGSVMGIFMLQGFLIGLMGTIIGISGGYGIGVLLNKYEIIKLPADVYYLSHLTAKMTLTDFMAVSVAAILISFLATVYPAWQASKLNPVEPLRYE